ncbi:hypothetical protein HPP92_003768 [Vanilla planifolia]|uniref:Uncharacterized protein n=1 Tax=Vanilla planifolia TaxID=51239 RepID=A0A835S7S9_VANPL|nr:hypothetical protein HPP92_003768 [Vanilla planifolia]
MGLGKKVILMLCCCTTHMPSYLMWPALLDSMTNIVDLLALLANPIGADGVNATIGGRFSALEEHIAAMKTDSLFYGTDFKLAPCCYPTNEKIAKECGFNSLSVRAVKELVTFRSDSMLKSPKILNAGRHLSATEFHHILQEAGNSSKCGETRKKEDVILLDVRNVYETRIGMFKVENVDTLDPKIRQYSDLATWMDDHSERLRNKKVLMLFQNFKKMVIEIDV